MSSRVWDALTKLYMERVGQDGVLSSSGSSASLPRDFGLSVGNASLSNRIKNYNTEFM